MSTKPGQMLLNSCFFHLIHTYKFVNLSKMCAMKKKNPLFLTIDDARTVARYAPPGAWTMVETPDGWLAKRGKTTLTTINTLQPRYFKNLETGVMWLKRELGLTEFKLLLMVPDVPAARPV